MQPRAMLVVIRSGDAIWRAFACRGGDVEVLAESLEVWDEMQACLPAPAPAQGITQRHECQLRWLEAAASCGLRVAR